VATACLLASLFSAPAPGATSLINLKDLNAGKARAEADLQADKAACDKLAGNPRDLCREQARGKELVAKAELELAHTGTRRSQQRLATIRLDTAYDLARTRCNDQTGSAKNTCTKQAQAARAQGQAGLEPHPAGSDAGRDAAHKAAAAKCDAMAADARARCLAAATAGKP
jgi:hypothetical protein